MLGLIFRGESIQLIVYRFTISGCMESAGDISRFWYINAKLIQFSEILLFCSAFDVSSMDISITQPFLCQFHRKIKTVSLGFILQIISYILLYNHNLKLNNIDIAIYSEGENIIAYVLCHLMNENSQIRLFYLTFLYQWN